MYFGDPMNLYVASAIAIASTIGCAVLAQSSCGGRFIDSIGVPGAVPNVAFTSAVEWDPDGAGPDKPLLVVAGMSKGAGYSFGGSVFAYDGNSWRSFGFGLGKSSGQSVTSLAVFRDELYAGGAFNTEYSETPLNGLARWDGAVWRPIAGNPTPANNISALYVYDDNLVVGIRDLSFMINGQNAGGVVRFDGINWHPMGQAPAGAKVFKNFGNKLFMGGEFTAASGTTLNNIACWDGTAWKPVGAPIAGVDWPVYALEVFNDQLIAGGQFTFDNGSTTGRLAQWSGSQWSELSDVNPNARVDTLFHHAGKLYVGGRFWQIGPQPISKLATWDSHNWQSAVPTSIDALTESPSSSQSVLALTTVAGQLFAVGTFQGVDEPAIGGGLSGVALVPQESTSPYGRLTSFEGMYLAGFAKYQGNLYGYGILGYDVNNHNTPSIAKLSAGRWQPVTGSLTPAYPYGGDILIGRLRASAEYQGKLAFVGTFDGVDGVAAKAVASFDGANWNAVVPSSLWSNAVSLYTVAIFEDSLVLAGLFENATTEEGAASNIVRWDGHQLHKMGVIDARVNIIRNLNGALYAGTATNAYQWNGSEWIPMQSSTGTGIQNVRDFALFNGILIAETGERAYRWNGTTWTSVDLSGSRYQGGLINYGGRLFRFGLHRQSQSFNARSWSGSGLWTGLGSPPDYQPLGMVFDLSLTCAIVHDGALYLGGFGGSLDETGINFKSPKGIIVARYTTDTLPRFEGQPTNQIFTLNQEARLQASLEAGAERPSIVTFQWQRNGAPIADGSEGASAGGGTVQGATSATLHIFGVQASDAGSYTLIATSSCGTQTSAPGELKVRLIPQDINADGFVNDADFELFVQQYDIMVCDDPSMPDGCSADFNANGIVDDADFALFIPAYEALFADGR